MATSIEEELDEESLTLSRSIPSPIPNIKCQDLLRHPLKCKRVGFLRQARTGKLSGILAAASSSINCPQRFVIVHEGCIYVYKSESDSKPDKAQSLFGFSQITRTKSPMPNLSWAFVLYFTLDVKQQKCFTFIATNETDMKQWMQCLKGEMLRANNISRDDSWDSTSDYTDLETPLSAPSDYLATVRGCKKIRAKLGNLSMAESDYYYSDAGNTRDSGIHSVDSISCSNVSHSASSFSIHSDRPLPLLPNDPPSSPKWRSELPNFNPMPHNSRSPTSGKKRGQTKRHPLQNDEARDSKPKVQEWLQEQQQIADWQPAQTSTWQGQDKLEQEQNKNWQSSQASKLWQKQQQESTTDQKVKPNFMANRPLPSTPMEDNCNGSRGQRHDQPSPPPSPSISPPPPLPGRKTMPKFSLNDPTIPKKEEKEVNTLMPPNRPLPTAPSKSAAKTGPPIPPPVPKFEVKKLGSPLKLNSSNPSIASSNDESFNTHSSTDTSTSSSSAKSIRNAEKLSSELAKVLQAKRQQTEVAEYHDQESYEVPVINQKQSPHSSQNSAKIFLGTNPLNGATTGSNANKPAPFKALSKAPSSPPKNSPQEQSNFPGWMNKNQKSAAQPVARFTPGGSSKDIDDDEDDNSDYEEVEHIEIERASDLKSNVSVSGSFEPNASYLQPSTGWRDKSAPQSSTENISQRFTRKPSPPTNKKPSPPTPSSKTSGTKPPLATSASSKPSPPFSIPGNQKWKTSSIQQGNTASSREMTTNESSSSDHTDSQSNEGTLVKTNWKTASMQQGASGRTTSASESPNESNVQSNEGTLVKAPWKKSTMPTVPSKLKQNGILASDRECENNSDKKQNEGMFGPKVVKNASPVRKAAPVERQSEESGASKADSEQGSSENRGNNKNFAKLMARFNNN